MKCLKNKCFIVVVAILLLLFLEMRPWQVCYSQITTASKETEIELHVLMNTVLPVNQKNLAEEVVRENIKINGWKEGSEYTVVFYKTRFHYQWGNEYNRISLTEEDVVRN